MTFFSALDDMFNLVNQVVDFLDFELLDVVDTFSGLVGLDLLDSIRNLLVDALPDSTASLLDDQELVAFLDGFEDLEDLVGSNLYDTVGQIIDGIDVTFFDNLSNVFEGIPLNFVEYVEPIVSDIDLDFLTDVTNIVNDFDLNQYLDAVVNPTQLNSDLATDLSEIVQTLDDLNGLSTFIEDKLIQGTELRDVIRGATAADVLLGLGGRDTLLGRNGDDLMNGGAGNDKLKGKGGIDFLFGYSGRDTLQGGSGADIIASSDGVDVMKGGPGRDRFLLQQTKGADRLIDFRPNKDTIQILEPVSMDDLRLLQRGDRTLIRFKPGSGFRGRIAWVHGIRPDQLNAENLVIDENLSSPVPDV